MADIPVKNNGKNPLPVGPYTIMPGETRHLPEQYVPEHLKIVSQTKADKAAPADALLDILDQSVPGVVTEITARAASGWPVISDAELARLKVAEENGKTRVSLMSAFAEEEIKRASENQDKNPPDDELKAFVEKLSLTSDDDNFVSDDELLELQEVHKDDELYLGAIEAEFEKRDKAAQQ